MKRHPLGTPALPACAAVLLAAAGLLLAAPAARAHNRDLSKPCEYTVGDAIAARAQSIFRNLAGLEAPTLVYYDRDASNIVVEIEGATEELEGARREIEGFIEAIRENVAVYARRRHGIVLTEMDVTLIYFNETDEDGPIEIVRREDGRFVVPKRAEEGDGNEGGGGR